MGQLTRAFLPITSSCRQVIVAVSSQQLLKRQVSLLIQALDFLHLLQLQGQSRRADRHTQ